MKNAKIKIKKTNFKKTQLQKNIKRYIKNDLFIKKFKPLKIIFQLYKKLINIKNELKIEFNPFFIKIYDI